MKELIAIQQELKAPKGQYNSFGKYNYRSCEDILEAVKPLLGKHDSWLTVTDEIVEVGGRVYVKATATLVVSGDNHISASAFAREPEAKKGMDESQITGAASSYARKYALNGLFCIDDNKDPDSTNTHGKADTPNVAADECQALIDSRWDSLTKEQQDWVTDTMALKNYDLITMALKGGK